MVERRRHDGIAARTAVDRMRASHTVK
uniref:Uncharacterized protein n=1 Tax=Arundo donax TaxID=35708 RepID=A0A0A8YTD0_ARUDO